MPKARSALEPVAPATLAEGEAALIREMVGRFYGGNAVVRNFGPDPRRLDLHVETDRTEGLERHECLGEIMCVIDRERISLVVTTRGQRVFGSAKIAYRQGVII